LYERLLEWVDAQGGRAGSAADTLDRWEARRLNGRGASSVGR
jgi:hypothetical protein